MTCEQIKSAPLGALFILQGYVQLASFSIEMTLCKGLSYADTLKRHRGFTIIAAGSIYTYRNNSSETGLHPTRAVSPAASTLRPAVLRIVTVTGASFCGSVTS